MTTIDPDVVDLEPVACYRALKTRDTRFDGRLYIGVVTTRIFCRPICPARPAKIENCVFLPSAAAAHRMGFRPCLRCRPEIAPGIAGWRGTANTVSRALQLIAEGALGEGNLEQFAERLGVGSRHLRRLFDRYVGASPHAVLQSHRLLFAKRLITETHLPMADIALAAGYNSIRRYNDAFRRAYHTTPTALRRHRAEPTRELGIQLQLPFTVPYDWRGILEFLAAQVMPGVERVEQDTYSRTFSIQGAQGVVRVQRPPGRDHLLTTIVISDVTALGAIVARVRRLFDLDADTAAIDAHLARDPLLARRVHARPGVRVPGAWDNFEVAVRVILGEQLVTSHLAGRIATELGARLPASICIRDDDPHLIFPEPSALARADLVKIGVSQPRARALHALSAAIAANPKLLPTYAALPAAVETLRAIPEIGLGTAQYIAMRALREPDALLATDAALRHAASITGRRLSPADLLRVAEAWRPWRAYAAQRLWLQPGSQGPSSDRTRSR